MRSVLARAATRRISASVAVAALAAIALTGCTASANGASCVQPGDASQQVSVSRVGALKGTFPKPLVSKTLQKSTATTGKGETVGKGQLVEVDLALYDGASGTQLEKSDTALVAGKTAQAPGLQAALACSTVGSRIAVTGTVGQILGSSAAQQNGVPTSMSVVAVMELKRAYLARANGSPQIGQPGMPTVVLAPSGQPGIKITDGAPTSQRTAVLRQGSGATVGAKDEVLVNYTAVTYEDPTAVASSSWSDGVPVIWPDGQSSSGYTVPSSVTHALVGQKVGSQLLIVTPGSNATAFVIDVLGIWK